MNNRIALSGSLNFVTLPEIFQILGSNNSTGVLKLTSKYTPHPGIIHFSKGNPINAVYGSLKGPKALYGMFGWQEGEYLFYEEDVSPLEVTITKGRMDIVLEALKLLDNEKIKKVGHSSSLAIHAGDKPDSSGMPVLKGPLTDYLYVEREDFYKKGQPIVREGKHGKWIWTVYEGVVRVTRDTPKGPLLLARLGEGCFIGTIRALLYGDYERNASVTAEADLRLCLLDVEPFYNEYSKLSPEFRRLLLSLDQRLRKLNIRAIEIFSEEKDDKEMLKLVSTGKVFEAGDGLYRITEGTAVVDIKNPEGRDIMFSLEANDVIGNIPFVDFGHEPNSAIIIPSKGLKTEKMDPIEIQKEYDKLSRTFKNLIYNICNYIRNTTGYVARLQVKNQGS
ncbi:MAG: cyclic nucleotide-binding domain-containing protein [Desulfatiglans sp.]|jgi:CRP-like cAMP-binding protein|nr:cyclic nucleotide-binding domain-containing protein [Desulfatiglans sp.]